MIAVLRPGKRLTKKKWQRVIDLVTEDDGIATRIANLSQPKNLRPKNAESLALKAAYVILNSGMKNAIAKCHWSDIEQGLLTGKRISYGHKEKVKAMKWIWKNRNSLFQEYRRHREDDRDLVEWYQTLPWIGPRTKYHLAMNCGADVCKPDVHLSRLAKHQGKQVRELCDDLAGAGGKFRANGKWIGVNSRSVVDRILWYALKDGVIILKGK